MTLSDNIIDFFVVSWIVSSVMLLLVFARYGYRSWNEEGPGHVYGRLSFFNGLIIHHIGNLILLSWFWFKVHQGELYVPTNTADRITIISGMAIACCGVLYKVRIFTRSAKEVAIVCAITIVLSVLSLIRVQP